MTTLVTPRSTTLIDIVFPGETNHHGTLFGGIGLAQMDKVAFIAAARHAPVDFVTASCERVDFRAPAHLGDIIELTGRVTRVGGRSLCVEVELVAEAPISGERRQCGVGRFNMVAVGPGITQLGGRLPPLDTTASSAGASDSMRMVELVFPEKTSHYGSLYGGNALAAMSKAAFVAATRHCRKAVVMASSQRVDFEHQIQTGEVVELAPKVARAGRTSMTVEVELRAESLRSGERKLCGRGTFVMVAVDGEHRPMSLAL